MMIMIKYECFSTCISKGNRPRGSFIFSRADVIEEILKWWAVGVLNDQN